MVWFGRERIEGRIFGGGPEFVGRQLAKGNIEYNFQGKIDGVSRKLDRWMAPKV